MSDHRTQAEVLLTYGWVRSSYAALCNLHAHGVRVAVADHHRFGMCQFSRYETGFFRTVSPFAQPDEFVARIRQILLQTGARVLIPSHDETGLLARHRDGLPAGTILPVAGYKLLANANDKAFVQAYAESVGIPTPRLVPWKDLDDLALVLDGWDWRTKLAIRLRRSNSAKGVRYAGSASEAIRQVRELISQYDLCPERNPIVQECVEGEGWGVSCLYWEGDLMASFTHRRNSGIDTACTRNRCRSPNAATSC